jgi:syndecan 4
MGSQSALLAVLVLGLVASLARCAPFVFAGRGNGTAERRWETLYSRSLSRNPGEKRDTSRDSDYLLGIKRLRRLYCNVGIGFHIQVLPDGRITGVHNENRYSESARGKPFGNIDVVSLYILMSHNIIRI